MVLLFAASPRFFLYIQSIGRFRLVPSAPAASGMCVTLYNFQNTASMLNMIFGRTVIPRDAAFAIRVRTIPQRLPGPWVPADVEARTFSTAHIHGRLA